MYDCKIVSVSLSQANCPGRNFYGLFRRMSGYKDGSAQVDVFESPELERALIPYLQVGYRVSQVIRLDGAYISFLMEKD